MNIKSYTNILFLNIIKFNNIHFQFINMKSTKGKFMIDKKGFTFWCADGDQKQKQSAPQVQIKTKSKTN